MLPKYVVLLLSGGLDSVVLLYYLVGQGVKVHAVLFDYKQRHVQELEWAKQHCRRLGVVFTVIEIPQLRGSELTDGGGTVVVPFRNPIMLALAVNLAVYAKAEEVAIACNSGDQEQFPDCRWATLDALNHAIKLSGYDVKIVAPFVNRSKAWIVGLGNELGVKFNETWSCYQGGIEPCGKCAACLKREEAMHEVVPAD